MNFPFLHLPDDLILGRTGRWRFLPSVRLNARQRTTHMHVIGITGQGKSKLLHQLLVQDILAGRGAALLDPHSDLADDLLAHLYQARFFDDPKRQARFLYFDPADRETLIPFNVLAAAGEPYDVAVNVVEAFRRTWPQSLAEAPRFTDILVHSLLTLIANRLSLVELQTLLTDRAYREALLEQADESEQAFFHQRFDRYGREQPLLIESVLNKASALTTNPRLRRILGHAENRLDFRRIMDEGQVLIVDLGRCDGETRRLLGSLIVTGMEQAALSRKDTPQRSRQPFYFYIDEFQDFCANESSTVTLAHILSESRKFGLHLTLAHQTLGQMRGENMRSALGNVGTQVVFAVDRADAEAIARKLFQVDGEQVKHEVANEYQQEKSHPVYYSLAEAWEDATQAIQNLRPRTCFVKRPGRAVVKVYTLPVREVILNAHEWSQVKQILGQQFRMQAGLLEKRQSQVGKTTKRFVDYRSSRSGRRLVITGMNF